MGSGKEREAIAEMARAVGPGALDLSGETDLETLAALLEACQVVICNDSGPMHLAAALGTPVVALFGSTDFVATAPMGPHRIVRTEAECSPCLRRECPENTYRCLDGISTEQVVSVTEEFLRERGALQGSRS
jgi:heptosyltransferase-2